MIAYLKGKVIDLSEESAVIENNGVGYEVLCSSSVLQKLCLGKESEIFTYMQVKEDGISLYGFDTKEEKRMFLKLISVSGVGPKIGIAALAGMELKDLVTAIATSDVKTLSKVKGLGKKTAERIILELREGVGKDEMTVISDIAFVKEEESKEAKDAVIALTGLGFNAAESKKAVSSAINGGAKSIEDIISYALRSLS